MVKKELTKKVFAIFVMILIVSTTFSISLSFSSTNVQSAEQEGCCLDTGKGQQCVRTTREECEGRFITGPPYDCANVDECKAQTCIPKPKDLACLRNKQVAECLANDGVPDAKQLEEIPQCRPGCCIIAKGVKAEVLQYRQCENLTLSLGYALEDIEFLDAVTSQIECKKQGSPSDLGCCTLGDGECKYGPRADCPEGTFVPLAGGLFCKDVSQCALTSHSYFDCGKLPGTETNIYWFDSQGNQEELYDNPSTSGIDGQCDYPEGLCKKTKTTAYCEDTTCSVEGKRQEMSKNSPKVDPRDVKEILLTGTSMCYNFFTSYGDEDMHGISTGLQNQILHCDFGRIEIQALGQTREQLCFPSDPKIQGLEAAYHANVKTNNWQNCSQCGNSKSLLGAGNELGDFLGPSWAGFPTGKMFATLFGSYCNKDRCEGLNGAPGFGDCVYHQDMSSGPLGTPVGSCDPKYPPGAEQSKCTDCGGGGDSVWNLCTKAECYSKGDCTFKPASVWLKAGTFAWFTVGLAISERIGLIIPECIATPIYCAINKNDAACLHPSNSNPIKCLGDRSLNYALGAPIWLIAGKGLGWVWETVSNTMQSTLQSKIGTAISEGINPSQKTGNAEAEKANTEGKTGEG